MFDFILFFVKPDAYYRIVLERRLPDGKLQTVEWVDEGGTHGLRQQHDGPGSRIPGDRMRETLYAVYQHYLLHGYTITHTIRCPG